MNPIAWAIPLFLAFIFLEYITAKKKNLPYFHLQESVANLSIGVAERLLDLFTAGFFFGVYDWLQHRFGIFPIRAGILSWVLLFLATDFVWYWYHRLAHEINLFWAAHIVHHQSEDFNYTVSARITVLQGFLRAGFWSVLPILGFPAPMITTLLLIHGLYPFFIHTRTIGKLGWLEYILVTPSHHRVHHARNEQYLDCNYGDVLIIWDKLFGTFVPETQTPEYGLTKPLNSHSFLWQHFHYFIELFYAMRAQKGWRNKGMVLWARPATIAPEFREIAEKKFLVRSRHRSDMAAQPFNRYVIGQLTGVLILLFVFLLWERHFNLVQKGLVTLIILLTLVNCGALMEQRRWIFYLEYVRFSLAVLLLYVSYPDAILLTYCTAIIIVLTVYEPVLKKNYFRWVGIPAPTK